MIEAQRVDFVAIMSQDQERSKRFYGETLGLKANEKAHDDWPEFETGNVTLLIVDPAKIQTPFSPNKAGIAIRVADVEAAMKRLQDEGVEFLFPEVYDSTVCHMAFFDDPDGNRLILHHRYAPYADGTTP